MLPHEKALVERLKDKPFALIGINSDAPRDLPDGLSEEERWTRTAEHVRKLELEQGLTWRNAVDGSTRGPLARRWNVKGWPTIYVLDARGVIRYRGHDGKAMESTVLALLAEMETPAK
jgi:hypothetical protein